MRLLVTVTFNANQLRAHLLPILRIPEVEEVVLVSDTLPPADLPKITPVVPSRAEKRSFGRAGSKLERCVRLAVRARPDWILSYNVMPHGVNAAIAGRLSGTRTMYHMIGGPAEWRGGGWRSGNAVLGRLPRPVQPLEHALLGVIRRATIVCTMGRSARAELLAAGLAPERVVIMPPSVDLDRFAPAPPGSPKEYDVMTVGDLIATKRQADFLAMVAQLRRSRPALRAAIAGAGPLEAELRALAGRLGISGAVDFLGAHDEIEAVYRSARVFVLSSRHEGLSVAMIEAMASGLPSVVTAVGDLADLVKDGRNGALVPVGDVGRLAAEVGSLLDDENRYRAASAAAREDVSDYSSVERLSGAYRRLLHGESPATEVAA